MKRALFIAAALIGLAVFVGIGCLKARAKELERVQSERKIELVVYSQDFAQVNEVRDVGLQGGTTRLALTDVSHHLDQSSLMYSWPAESAAQVTSTTYDLGTDSGETLLQQLVGRKVTLVYRGDNGREAARQDGILEVAAPGNIVVRVGDSLVVNPQATIETQAGEVATMPRLTATVEDKKEEKVPLTVSYMTRGLSWAADYLMTLDPGSDPASLECWATVTNNTGIDFPAASIKFIAGSPNRAVIDTLAKRQGLGHLDEDNERARPASMAMGGAGAQFQAPEAMGEMISYPYESQATLRNNQTNRVLMMKAPKVTVVRDYAINLNNYYYSDPQQRLKATLSLAFKNEDAAGLGQPLPLGRVRVYEPAKGGPPVFIGAAQIGNVPKDDRIDLTLTEVFNLYARQKTTETKRLDKRHVQTSYEVTVYNEKDKQIDVRLVRDFYGAWSVVHESTKSSRPNAAQAQWVLSVPAGGSTKLSYTVVTG